MRTALDADPSQLDDEEQKFVSDIREFGWFDTHVFDGDPSFSYTTGFRLRSSPEFILFSLNRTVAHDIFWDLYRDAASGKTYPLGCPVLGVLGNATAYFFDVAERHQSEYLGWSRWFYGQEIVPTVQLVWPDPAGRFPWEMGFDESFRNSQPDLTESGWLNEVVG